jgi:hypothetical protein
MIKYTKTRARLGAFLGAATLAATYACANLVGAGDYSFVDPETATNRDGGLTGDGSCQDPNGFGGVGCFACPPSVPVEYLNACSGADCRAFDEARLTTRGADGGLPAIPPPPPPADAGASDSGTPATDAGPSTNPLCSSLPNPTLIVGGRAAIQFYGTVAQVLAIQGSTVLFKSASSCDSTDALVNGKPQKGTASYWDPNVADVLAAEKQCDLPAEGIVPDLARSDIFATTCFSLPQGLPKNVGDVPGAVQTLVAAVPASSPETTISEDALYMIFGFGSASGIQPWTDETAMYKRPSSGGSLRMASVFWGIPATQWKGVQVSTADQMVAGLFQLDATKARSGIGIMFMDSYDANRSKLKALGIKARGQGCAMWPDSTPTSLDKRNVRDGHYALWGPSHFFVRLDAAGVPSNDAARSVLGYASGSIPYPKGDIVQLYQSQALIPQCAMRVTRTQEAGPIKAYKPDVACGCYFDALTTGRSSCVTCTSNAQCSGTQSCSFGYCEEQ